MRKEIGINIYRNEEVKLKHKENTIKGLTEEAIRKSKRWLLDEDKKNHMIQKVKESMSVNKDYRSTIQKESWTDEKLLKRHSLIMKEISNRPDVKNKIRDSLIKKVYQYSIDGELVNVWDSVIDASISLNMSKSGIANNCRGLSKTSNGFIWSYTELD